MAIACAAQESARDNAKDHDSQASTGSGMADGTDEVSIKKQSPALTGERRPLYRLHRSDVLDVEFTFSPEFNQTVSVQPDGFITLRGVPQLQAEGLTIPQLTEALRTQYSEILNDPEVAVVLQDYTKPYFSAIGEVQRPGKYELRDDITLTEGLALAGGFNSQAKHSQIVLFRKVDGEMVESRLINTKALLKARKLGEDIHLRPGDLVYVPKNAISKIRQYMPTSSLSVYSMPQEF
jgi:polysaccharide biosynthesis/export protein